MAKIYATVNKILQIFEQSLVSQNTFTISTKHRTIIVQNPDKDIMEWVYALDPLETGTIRYVFS